MSVAMIKVMIADDHAIVREGLKRILANIQDMDVTLEAISGDDAHKKIKSPDWDVLVIDISMPGKNILELLKLSKILYPLKPILVLSMYPEDQYAIRMLRAGADGYLNKESASEKLVSAIRKLAEGGKYISTALTDQLINEINAKNSMSRHSMLTNREFQVFIELAKGKRLSDIALEMSLSIKTVSTYRTRLIKKLCVSSNSDIIHYALAHNLI